MSECSWAGGNGREEEVWSLLFPCCPMKHQCLWQENPDRKK